MEKDGVANMVSELSGCLVLLADVNPYTKTSTGTTLQEQKKVEPNEM